MIFSAVLAVLISSQGTGSNPPANTTSSNNRRPYSWLFPFVPRTIESMVSILFWHSLLMTSTTPLSRLLSPQWKGKLIMATILNFFGIPQLLFGRPAIDSYLVYPPSAKTDQAFGPHAFFGLLWIILAYLHMTHKFQSHKLKKPISYFAALAFVLHMAYSLNTLILDPMEHHPLIWFMLATNISVSSAYFLLGIYAIVAKRDLAAHRDAMMRCFIYSIEGAGTIRSVGAAMHLVDMGPTICQQMHGGLASSCVFSYVQRLIGIRLLTTYYVGVYSKMQKNQAFWKTYQGQAAVTIFFVLAVVSAFTLMRNAERFFEELLSPFGNKEVAVTGAIVLGITTFLFPDSPLLQTTVESMQASPKRGLSS